jgi:glycosyltransferase involved in cell wall biosynthesis
MIYLNLALGSNYGWGICGKNIARQLARLESVRIISEPFDAGAIGDLLEFHELDALLSDMERDSFTTSEGVRVANGPLLQGIANETLVPRRRQIRGKTNVGYTFFERNLMQPDWVENGRRFFDRVVAGSSWCAEVLAEHGLSDVSTVVQGIDPEVFFPSPGENGHREFLADKFVVFSGGKFELRKSQDIVISAYKILQDRHRDVMLINAWFNPWPAVMDTMQASPLICFTPLRGPYVQMMNQVLADNGIDVGRVITCPPQASLSMARLYRNTDVGVFPNRCEGGTNLVLMEYMACGRPVIAVNTTGHADIITPSNALIIATRNETTVRDAHGIPVGRWPEPDLDDVIDKLEWAYQNRDKLQAFGEQAGKDLANPTWRETAKSLREIIYEVSGAAERASVALAEEAMHPAQALQEHECGKAPVRSAQHSVAECRTGRDDSKAEQYFTSNQGRQSDTKLLETSSPVNSRVNNLGIRNVARSMRQTEAIIIGTHHKTGSNLLITLLKVIEAKHWLPARVVRARPEERKLPLSGILKNYSAPLPCYVDTWFEHEVDVPEDSVRFLHFVRHPANWVRSAYLYHKKGGPSEAVPWLKWRLFRNGGQYISYHELLNGINDERGVLIEAVRSYPEIAGTARAAATSSHLLKRVQLSLEQFHSDFDSSIRSICEFLELDSERSEEITYAMTEHDFSKRHSDELPLNVTRNSSQAAYLERYLMEDPEFRRLYAQPGMEMGFPLDSNSVRSGSLLDKSIIDQILEAQTHLLTHPYVQDAQEVLQADTSGNLWLAYALQSFGQGGHLMMHQFIQRILDEA